MLLFDVFIILSYAFLGGGIKYADQAYDIGVFSTKKANVVAFLSAVLMAGLMVFDSSSTVIFFSILLIVALTKKIDNMAFYVGTGILLFLPFVAGFFGVGDGNVLHLEWLPFGVLIFSGILDELGNDWADKRRKLKRLNNLRNGLDESIPKSFGEIFFLHRFTMKISLFFLTIAGVFHFLYFFAFLVFDFVYALVEWYSFSLKYYSLTKPALAVRA
ncbi:MAG: hypothetical protein JW778_04640 [Candidatus Altiarchaeota archaeon]|nr:hypothetical protein [Candidatus Altiarchaeota archaeon]